MSNSVLDFWWYVPETAFFWTDAPALNAGPGRRLTTGLPMEAADHVRGYRPFDGGRLSGLFRQFAATKPTEAGILSFASSYGCLLDPERQDIISFTPDTEAPYYGYGEPLAL
ncbi:MAG TPA: hypothetical protein VNT01_12530, partial [Symbiobacteriaceae bacterium]|nr:hypothetical protein [Symbiobacteriaceae bacterium]